MAFSTSTKILQPFVQVYQVAFNESNPIWAAESPIRNHIVGENQFIIAEDIAVFNKSTFLNITLS